MLTSDDGGGDKQMYFVHTADRCTRKLSSSLHFTDKQACAPLPDLLWAVHRSPPSPVHRWGPHQWLQQHAQDPIKKSNSCVLCSLKWKAYFIPYEPNSLQSLGALVVCYRWKLSSRGCLFWHLVGIQIQFEAWSVDGGRLGSASYLLTLTLWDVKGEVQPNMTVKSLQQNYISRASEIKKWIYKRTWYQVEYFQGHQLAITFRDSEKAKHQI